MLVIDPERRAATVYRSRSDVHADEGDATIELGDAVPGWRPPLAELLA